MLLLKKLTGGPTSASAACRRGHTIGWQCLPRGGPNAPLPGRCSKGNAAADTGGCQAIL